MSAADSKVEPHHAIHSNGGAQVVGADCHVSRSSFCDKDSRVTQSKVFHSSLVGSSVYEGSVIVGSQLSRCLMIASIIDGAIVDGPMLRDVVAENCELYGPWRLEGIARIPCGIWYRAPRFIEIASESRIPGHDIRAGITESTDGHALIACMRKPLSQWLGTGVNNSPGRRLGRMLGWTDEQTMLAYRTFEEWRDCPIEA